MIKRDLYKDIKDHLFQKEITLITGPRQAGKTTLMQLLKEDLDRRGERTLFLNLDIEADSYFFSSQQRLLKKIELEIGKERGFVFIDEVQRKENAGLFFKGIYDMNLPYKFIMSGSGSMELKEKIHESLVGRKRVFELNTISFHEFVNFKTGYRYTSNLRDFFELDKEKTLILLWEYLNFGGYPRLVTEDREIEKRSVIDEIYSSYLEKDISFFLNVGKIEAFKNLIRMLSSGAGQIVNYSGLANATGLSIATLKNYLFYAESTYVIKRLQPYFVNKKKEITKSPKVYFYDIGLRNYCSGVFGNLGNMEKDGFAFENMVFNILRDRLRYTGSSIRFWRTKDRAEVDFVITKGNEVIPIEVKYMKLKSPQVTRSLSQFIKKHNPKRALIVNIGYRGSKRYNSTTVDFLPFYDLIFMNRFE